MKIRSPRLSYPHAAALWVTCLLEAVISPGCSSSKSTYIYSAPDEYVIQSRVLVHASYDEVWNRMMHGIRAAGWELGAEDRDLGRIRFTIPAADPEHCVDCGRLRQGVEEFDVTSSRAEKRTGTENRRMVELEARAVLNIVREQAGTGVAVDIWYALDVDDTHFSQGMRTQDRVVRTPITNEKGELLGYNIERIRGKTRSVSRNRHNSIQFTTAGGDSSNWNTRGEPLYITCRSTGWLEQSILALASEDH